MKDKLCMPVRVSAVTRLGVSGCHMGVSGRVGALRGHDIAFPFVPVNFPACNAFAGNLAIAGSAFHTGGWRARAFASPYIPLLCARMCHRRVSRMSSQLVACACVSLQPSTSR